LPVLRRLRNLSAGPIRVKRAAPARPTLSIGKPEVLRGCRRLDSAFRRGHDWADRGIVVNMRKRSLSRVLTLLVSCVGRRVELLQAFRAAAKRLGVKLTLIGSDTTATAPALSCADKPVLVPPIEDAGYIPALLETARKHRVNALMPTIDTDLVSISQHREEFQDAGCLPLIADLEVVNICRDKILTHEFLTEHGIDTPETYTPEQLDAIRDHRFPYFIKPRYGSASLRVHKIEDEVDLNYFVQRVREPIIQEFVDGLEHTLDVYVGLTGEPRCVVPRARWQVRGGEVSKGVVVKDRKIMDAGRELVEALGRSVRGVVTLQCIVTADHRIRFIEINPRFGGGAPLGIAAGADYPAWLIQELLGETPKIQFDGFRHGLCMLRYDWSVFIPLDADLTPRIAKPLRDFVGW
jgi:carbamoyl-phosphate synthase large subunit